MSTCVDCVTSSGSTCTKWKLSFHGPCHQRRPKCRKLHARPLPCSKCRNSPSRRVEPISTVLRQMNNGSKLRHFWECRLNSMPYPKNERRGLQWMLCLLITSASAFGFTQLHEIVSHLGLIPAQATRDGGATFLTSFFLHAGILHLVGNIYFLFVFGDDVENFLRPFRYLALIAFAAFIGDLAHIAADPHSQIPCVGASGGIAGVITFYALSFPRVKLGFLMRYGWWWFRWIRLPTWFVFVLWILFQFVGAWEQVAGISAVSSVAHIGGAVVGFVAWLFWRKNNSLNEEFRSNSE